MSEDRELEVYRQFRAFHDKYTYFLLAVSGSAIAYALNRAENRNISIYLLPWGIALLLWAMSFYFGCQHLTFMGSALFANFELLKVKSGKHPEIGLHPEKIMAASEGISDAIKNKNNNAVIYRKLQFIFFILGIISYVVWQLIEMSISK
jgi:hypothetical protein